MKNKNRRNVIGGNNSQHNDSHEKQGDKRKRKKQKLISTALPLSARIDGEVGNAWVKKLTVEAAIKMNKETEKKAKNRSELAQD